MSGPMLVADRDGETQTMKVYLAGRFSRRAEFAAIAAQLTNVGIEVTSRWLAESDHMTFDKLTDQERSDRAYYDQEDIIECDVFVSFGETPEVGYNSGGRHVEFGMALALGKPILLLGHRENVFHYFPYITFSDANVIEALLIMKEHFEKDLDFPTRI